MPDADPLAAIRDYCGAAPAPPWTLREKHGRDIAGEGWSEVVVTDAADRPVVAAYITGVFEPESGDEATAFLTRARTDLPRLLAVADAALRLAGRWDADAAELWKRNASFRERHGIPAGLAGVDAVALQDRARELREVISAALLGQGDPAPGFPEDLYRAGETDLARHGLGPAAPDGEESPGA